MSDTTIRARSLPYREPRPKAYDCGRCGRECARDYRPTATNDYCRDCKPEAIALGWTTPLNERKAA